MLKIKLFIVTYNNSHHLNRNLQSFFQFSDVSEFDFSITIINNHTNFDLEEHFKDKVTVLHNQVRPDQSTGNLARSWNQCLLNGFKSLTEPDCDILIHCQDDIIWTPGGFNRLIEFSEVYDIITIGPGDQVVCVRPGAIRKIGLWDERIHSCGFHEMDYYLRMVLYNPSMSSINDDVHQLLSEYRTDANPYLWNPLGSNVPIINRANSNNERSHDKVVYSKWHHIGREVFFQKWKRYPETYPLRDVPTLFVDGPTPNSIPTFYPWFEKDVFNLQKKGYIWVDPYSWY